MSRSGYGDYDCDCDNWDLIRWRGAVTSAIRGKRGQAFLRELLTALDVLPEKRLIAHELEAGGEVCALGSVGRARGIDMSRIDPNDYDAVAGAFGISAALAREIVSENDDTYMIRSPEQRWQAVRAWVTDAILAERTR